MNSRSRNAKVSGPGRATRAQAQADLDRSRRCTSRADMKKFLQDLHGDSERSGVLQPATDQGGQRARSCSKAKVAMKAMKAMKSMKANAAAESATGAAMKVMKAMKTVEPAKGVAMKMMKSTKTLHGPRRATRAQAQANLDGSRRCTSRADMAKFLKDLHGHSEGSGVLHPATAIANGAEANACVAIAIGECERSRSKAKVAMKTMKAMKPMKANAAAESAKGAAMKLMKAMKIAEPRARSQNWQRSQHMARRWGRCRQCSKAMAGNVKIHLAGKTARRECCWCCVIFLQQQKGQKRLQKRGSN